MHLTSKLSFIQVIIILPSQRRNGGLSVKINICPIGQLTNFKEYYGKIDG